MGSDLNFDNQDKCELTGISNEIIHSKGVVGIELDFEESYLFYTIWCSSGILQKIRKLFYVWSR